MVSIVYLVVIYIYTSFLLSHYIGRDGQVGLNDQDNISFTKTTQNK